MKNVRAIDVTEAEEPKPAYDSAGMSSLSTYVKDIFESFKTSRLPFEEIWTECWYNFIGQYQQDLVWKRKTEGRKYRSRIFIKLTGLKCHTAHSKLADVLFTGRSVMPFNVEALEPEVFGIPTELAKEASERMKKRLKDHFKKISLKKKMDIGILEMAIFGAAVLKGPIPDIRRIPRVSLRSIAGMPVNEIDPEINPYEMGFAEEIVPDIDRVSIWEYYVDANARSAQDSIGEIQFKRMLPADFRRLAYQGGYVAAAVEEAARRGAVNNENDKTYILLGDNYTGTQGEKDKRVPILEYWGLVPVKMLREAGVQVPEEAHEEDSLESLVMLAADGLVIKACVNPLGRRPFYVCPFKEKPGQIYGTGPAEMMRDSQKMINSAARLLIDNKALSGNGMVGVNLDRINTKRTKNLDIYPGKTWYVKGNFSPREAVDAVSFPDVTMGLRELIEMFERFADEETGIPKYTMGMQSDFLNKTATGMSMLMTQANINLKTVIENIDDYWIEPIVEAFGQWFQAFGDDQLLRLPLKYTATGTDSMIAKEIKMENYMRFLQITSSPQDAIFMDRVKLMKAIARLLETEDVMRAEEEIAQIMKTMSQQATAPADLRSRVNIEKLYPFLTRAEQCQILKQIGVEPDMSANPLPALPQGGASSSPPASLPAGQALPSASDSSSSLNRSSGQGGEG